MLFSVHYFDIYDTCIFVNVNFIDIYVKISRLTIKALLNHQFFQEDETKIKIEIINDSHEKDVLHMAVKFDDPKKKKKDDRTIQFAFHLKTDNVEQIANEMVNTLP